MEIGDKQWSVTQTRPDVVASTNVPIVSMASIRDSSPSSVGSIPTRNTKRQ